MKAILTALLLTAASSGLALASPCQDDLKKVDAALESAELSAEQRAQAEDMRNQAVQLCGAGNDQEGVDVLTEAKALLAIE